MIYAPGKGLPDDVNFDSSSSIVPMCVPSNIIPLSLFLQCITYDGKFTLGFPNAYSNNVVVTD